MEKTICSSVGPKVSQIATIFQKKPIEMPEESLKEVQTNTNVVRTESHAARFNNARALFEKLGENKGPRTDQFGNRMIHSGSREDILSEESPERVRSPSPKRKQYPVANNASNGVTKMESAKIYNVSRVMKSEKPEKPEKPERKFNSRELIEKQKNWTSHFTKTRTTRFNSDPNRCDIIRKVPGTTLISGSELFSKEPTRSASFSSKPTELSLESPPSPPIRQPPPPEIKPRNIKVVTSPMKIQSVLPSSKPHNIIKTSPTKVNSFDYQISPTKTIVEHPNYSPYTNKFDEIPEKQRKRSFDEHMNRYPERDAGSTGVSTSPSASSGPSSPNHTEDEKQENEDTEKSDKIDECADYNDKGRTTPTTDRSDHDIQKLPSNVTIRSKKVTSICLNIPAAGLGSRPPSLISSISTDEGGFNEPLPEIKAIVKPAYPFEPPKYEIFTTDYNSYAKQPSVTSPPPPNNHFNDDDPKLNYVDVGYRLNPDGSESKEVFGETELYQTSIKNSVLEELENEERIKKESYSRSIYTHNLNGNNTHGNIYATIKPEIPPPTELLLNFKNHDIIPPFPDFDGPENDKVYHSPQTILDPTRPSLVGGDDDNISKSISPEPPMRPPLPEGPPLDLCDVEFADASDNEEVEENLPDAMTAEEADRLLSSRQQPLLSDEQAREVEQILSSDIENSKVKISEQKPEKDEPDWLKDVLAPKEKLNETIDENLNSSDDNDKSLNNTTGILNQTFVESSFQESIVSIDSMPSVGTDSIRSITVSTLEESTNRIDSERFDDISGVNSFNDADESADDSHQSYIPEYPPVKSKEVHFEGGVHYFEDGNFWMEVPGLMESEVEDEDEDLDYSILVKKNTKVKFSTGPIQVFSTFSVTDYDRRNEDVDPVAASAEYELEKRVEKMDVFPVELMKGPEGLGLSIIGMGVGADAGLEKLGIFIKTITDNGAAARDSRIQVNDQIIEVDGKSLVGVTQAYAASVLRNTSGLVKFLIGRERDPDNSEVAQLIRQSLQADREKEERMKKIYRQQDEYLRRTSEHSEDSTLPASANSSVSEEPLSPTAAMDSLFDAEASHSQEVESLKRLLQENHNQISRSQEENLLLRDMLVKLESTGNDSELLSERLKQTERELANIKKEAINYQNMLQQSQGQYMTLDKKYNKAKRIVREFQQREIDMVHREEFYQQLLQEKDTEYNALVKNLKDRVIHLEQELEETQRKAGLPIILPYESSSLKLTPQMTRRQPPKPFFQKLETELSDTEISDLSPDGEAKTSTVERKIPVKDELDTAVPQHELLDNSANKTKASRGLANRQLPSGKKSVSSSSDCGLEESEEEERTDSTSISHENNSYTNGHYRQQQNVQQSIIAQNSSPLYAQVHKDRDSIRTDSANNHSTIPTIYRTSNEIKSNLSDSYGNDLNSSYDSILSASDKLSDNGSNSENLSQQNRRPKLFKMPFSDELSQVLAESKGRRTGDGASRESSDDYTELNRQQNPAAIMTQNLVVEIRQAVNEAQPKVKNVVPQSLSPPGTVPWQQHNQLHQSQSQGPPSPSSISSGSISPGGAYSPSRTLDLSGSSTSFSSDRKAPHYWQNGPVPEWSKDQVCQWLMALGLEKHISKFLEHGVEGGALLQLDSRDFKILGVTGDDKSKLKRKLKELKHIIEKEKRQMEKDKKEREKLIKKAEKKAEKQAKKK